MSSILKYFKSEMTPATLHRFSSGTYGATGKWVQGGETSSSVSILKPQPATGEIEKFLPDGEELSDFVTSAIDSDEAIKTRAGDQDPDEVTVGSERYEVYMVGRWGSYGGFDRMILRRKQ